MAKKKFDWKILARKAVVNCAYIFLAGLASLYGDSSWYLALVPIFAAVENYWKHK